MEQSRQEEVELVVLVAFVEKILLHDDSRPLPQLRDFVRSSVFMPWLVKWFFLKENIYSKAPPPQRSGKKCRVLAYVENEEHLEYNSDWNYQFQNQKYELKCYNNPERDKSNESQRRRLDYDRYVSSVIRLWWKTLKTDQWRSGERPREKTTGNSQLIELVVGTTIMLLLLQYISQDSDNQASFL